MVLYSCSLGTEDLFEDSANNRISNSLKEYKKILCGAENGWIMKYYPSPTQAFGGYNLLVSFSEDGYSTVASELEDVDATCKSLYRLKEMAGPVLTFDTENKFLHFFSDPASGIGSIGLGMEGDYEFLFVDVTPEKIILKGKKTGNEIEMVPVPKDLSWKNYLSDISEGLDKIEYFVMFNYTVNNKDYSIIRSNRMFSISYVDDNGDEQKLSVPFIQGTGNSLEFYSPLSLGGVDVNKLFYDEETGIWKDDENKVELSGVIPPKSFAFMSGLPWYVTYNGLSNYGKQATDNAYNQVFTDGNGFEVVGIGDFGSGKNSITFLTKDENVGTLILDMKMIDDDKIGIMLTGYGNEYAINLWDNGASVFYALFANLDQYREFVVATNHPTKPTEATLTEVGNEENVIALTTSEVVFGR